jgi:hypothetical protein
MYVLRVLQSVARISDNTADTGIFPFRSILDGS